MSDPTMKPVASNRRYVRDLPPISAQAAEAEPKAQRVFEPESLPADLGKGAPAPVVEAKPRKITLQTTVEHRGRVFTIVSEGMTLDQFCDLLDERGYAPPASHAERAREAPICEYHGPMKESSKRPGTYYCPSKMGDNTYCKSKG